MAWRWVSKRSRIWYVISTELVRTNGEQGGEEREEMLWKGGFTLRISASKRERRWEVRDSAAEVGEVGGSGVGIVSFGGCSRSVGLQIEVVYPIEEYDVTMTVSFFRWVSTCVLQKLDHLRLSQRLDLRHWVTDQQQSLSALCVYIVLVIARSLSSKGTIC